MKEQELPKIITTKEELQNYLEIKDWDQILRLDKDTCVRKYNELVGKLKTNELLTKDTGGQLTSEQLKAVMFALAERIEELGGSVQDWVKAKG